MGTKYLDIDGNELTEAEYTELQEKGLKKKGEGKSFTTTERQTKGV